MAGWVYVKGKVNESEFNIHFSSWVSDTSIFIHFFKELVNLKDEITLFLDNEGSYPLLYAKKWTMILSCLYLHMTIQET